jgi:hypothetical protein
MGSIIKVNEYKDFGNNAIMTSDGAGGVTPNAQGLQTTPFFARYNTAQAVANATETVLQFANNIVDNGADWDSTNYRWIPQASGTYFIYAYIAFDDDSDFDIAQVRIRKNGSDRIAEGQARSEFKGTHYGFAMVSLNGTTDYVDCTAYHEEGGSVNVGNGTEYVTNFGGYRMIS